MRNNDKFVKEKSRIIRYGFFIVVIGNQDCYFSVLGFSESLFER